MRLTRLMLTDFRSYPALVWSPDARLAVITGQNGSGKTNLLEAVSLLGPGRGLRGARLADLARRGGSGHWAVAARLETDAGLVELGTGTNAETGERRAFRLDGATPRSQAAIAAVFAAIWLTPQMDRLFLEGPSGRRRFLDRLVYALEPGHAREVAAHDNAVASRNRLLAGGGAEPAWLAGLEHSIARHATAATAARLGFVARFNACHAGGESAFPAARLALICPIAERLAATPALAVEDWLRNGLRAARVTDAASSATSLGAHRTDLALFQAGSELPASLASTGEQKVMLIGTILVHASLVAQARGMAPLLLLDEPLVHLDEERRAALFSSLLSGDAQALITGTDAGPFAPLSGHASAWVAGSGKLSRTG